MCCGITLYTQTHLVVHLVLLVEERLYGALDGPGDLVDVLRLHHRLQVVLQDLGEVVLQLAPPEVRQDLSPVRRVRILGEEVT